MESEEDSKLPFSGLLIEERERNDRPTFPMCTENLYTQIDTFTLRED